MKPLTCAVIGCGYWGSHLIRNFYTSDQWQLKIICDTDPKRLNKFSKMYPNLLTTRNYDDILNDTEIDAIVIATPVHTHYALAIRAIEAGKHTWVEKPLTSDSAEAEKLVIAAHEKGVLLHVDHTYVYTPAVKKIKSIIQSGQLGDIYYFDSVRINLGLFQHDINVIWDLAPHDISILEHTLNKKPVSVNATGQAFLQYSDKPQESIAYVTINFEDGSIAHLHVNWMSPVKIRHIIIGGSDKMLVFNDMETMAKIKVYDSGVSIKSKEDVYNALLQYRTGDMFSPAIENDEALEVECRHLYDSIINNKKTATPGEAGLYVVKILEAADRSLKEGGKNIKVEF